jgi:hypothetical protein
MFQVAVPTGVGDIFWVYQKLRPYVDTIHFNIMCASQSAKLESRAVPFLELLPGVSKVSMLQLPIGVIKQELSKTKPLTDILATTNAARRYSVNYALEQGIRLDAIDPDRQVLWDVNFNVSQDRHITEDYLLVYVSGTKHKAVWRPRAWARLVHRLSEQIFEHQLPIVLLGAPYDAVSLDRIQVLLREWFKLDSRVITDSDAATSIRIIRDAKFFVGYQSGLNVIADNYDVPQLMVYFNWLSPMLYTWCQPCNIRTKFFAYTFGQGWEGVWTQFESEFRKFK